MSGLVGTDMLDAPGMPDQRLKLALVLIVLLLIGENAALYARLSWPAALVAVPLAIAFVALVLTWRIPSMANLRMPLVGLIALLLGVFAYTAAPR